MMDSVLVTGGCGFVGANLVRRLTTNNYNVVVFDNLSRGSLEYLDGIDVNVVTGDIRNEKDIEKAIARVSKVVHLAAFGSVVESIQDPQTNFDINACGTVNMLKQAVKANIEKFVFASTGGALIGDAIPPVSENSLPRPISPYGASKLCGEGYAHAFAQSFGLNTIALRFANVYGPYSGHKKGVITQFMQRIPKGEPLVIFGDGKATRDFLHVDDLCRGITSALEATTEPGEVVHVASGVETSVSELAQSIIEVSGKHSHPIIYDKKRVGEVERNFANYDRANQLFGFRPHISLKQGLLDLWDWFQANT